MTHNNPGNYPDPMPPMGEACPAPKVMTRPIPPPGCDRGTMINQNLPTAFCNVGHRVDHTMPMHPDAYYAGYRAALDNNHAMTTKTVPSVIPDNPFEPDTPNHRQFCNGYADAVRG